jgi:hypothetical protein
MKSILIFSHILLIGDDEKEGPIILDSGLNDTFLVDQFINNHSLPLFAEISIGNWGQLLSLKKVLISY